MIGIIQKVLMEVLETTGGDDLKSRVLERAGLPKDQVFHINRNYSDDEWQRLYKAAMDETGMAEDAMCDVYSDAFIARTRKTFPGFYKMASNARSFLLKQPAIHASIGAGLADPDQKQAVADKFDAFENDDGTISVTYDSPNQHCILYRSLARCAAKSYGEEIFVDKVTCKARGDNSCQMKIRWDN